MAGHTEGEWFLEELTHGQNAGCYAIRTHMVGPDDLTHKEPIARTLFSELIGAKEHKANAHLIAAAPELYEACVQALMNAEDYGDECIAELLKEAIAKAEGKQNSR
jgi:hypothetical protein